MEFRDFEEIAVCTIDAGNIHDWPLMLELKRKENQLKLQLWQGHNHLLFLLGEEGDWKGKGEEGGEGEADGKGEGERGRGFFSRVSTGQLKFVAGRHGST